MPQLGPSIAAWCLELDWEGEVPTAQDQEDKVIIRERAVANTAPEVEGLVTEQDLALGVEDMFLDTPSALDLASLVPVV